MTTTAYTFGPDERAALDRWLQQIPSGSPEEAMLQAMRLILRHDLANIQMAVLGYETFLRDADRALAQVSDLLGKLVPLVERVAVLEAQQSQSGIDRKELRERMRIQENEMVLLKREVALLKTQMQPVRLTDAPG